MKFEMSIDKDTPVEYISEFCECVEEVFKDIEEAFLRIFLMRYMMRRINLLKRSKLLKA